jgi:hypothetical protein
MLRLKGGGVDSSGSEYVTLYNLRGIAFVSEELLALLEGFTCVSEELLALLEDSTQWRYLIEICFFYFMDNYCTD